MMDMSTLKSLSDEYIHHYEGKSRLRFAEEPRAHDELAILRAVAARRPNARSFHIDLLGGDDDRAIRDHVRLVGRKAGTSVW
jgi:hypothetical protein